MVQRLSTLLGLIMLSIVLGLTDSQSPDLGAPDSSSANTQFTPDDSVTGATDTSADNSNATPLVLTLPPATSPATTQITAAATTASSVTAPTTAAGQGAVTQLTTTSPPVAATTQQPSSQTVNPSNTGAGVYNYINQYPYNPRGYYERLPYYNTGGNIRQTGFLYGPQRRQQRQFTNTRQLQTANNAFNIPWWMLMMDA